MQGISASDKPNRLRDLLPIQNIETTATFGLAILVAYELVRSLVAAATIPFWYDEMCTYIVTTQPTVSRIWSALERAVDGQPPGFYLIERAFASVVPYEEIAFRLPSIIAACLTTVCIFIFLRGRLGRGYAVICASTLLLTSLFHFYATEARPYSLVVLCVSIILLCYQRAPASGWMLLMALMFGLSLTLSYYAIFVFAPFGLAELVFLSAKRQVRWRVWMALLCGGIPLALLWPLLAEHKRYYLELPFAKPSLSAIMHVYGSILGTSPTWGVATASAISIFVLIILLSVPDRKEGEGVTRAQLHEYVLALALLNLPLIGYVLAKIVHSGLTERYVLSAVLGVPLAAAQILPTLGRRGFAVVLSFLVLLFGVQEATYWKAQVHRRLDSPAIAVERLLDSAAHPEIPVVVSDAGEYLSIAHYAAPAMAKRLVCLVDIPASRIFAGGDDVMDKELTVLRLFTPLQILDFQDFVSRQHSFLLYSSNGSGGDPHDWWTARLVQEGYSVRVVAAEQRRSIFLVTVAEETR